jgi:hypothetical protein
VIVGINASYSFEPSGDIPVTNWHTRLDRQARYGVASWLEALGVSVTKSCREVACMPSAISINPCDDMDPRGKCTGSVLEWCENGAYKTVDCATKTDGRTACGEDPRPNIDNNCIAPVDSCRGIGFAGLCTGTVLEWCERGVYKRVDCATKTDGRTKCGEDPSPTIGLNCVR